MCECGRCLESLMDIIYDLGFDFSVFKLRGYHVILCCSGGLIPLLMRGFYDFSICCGVSSAWFSSFYVRRGGSILFLRRVSYGCNSSFDLIYNTLSSLFRVKVQDLTGDCHKIFPRFVRENIVGL